MSDSSTLKQALAAFDQSVKRRLVLWVVRWTLAFAVIGVTVYLRPDMTWLWWVGAALAAVSLAATLAVHFLVQRRVAKGRKRIVGYKRRAREAEREAAE